MAAPVEVGTGMIGAGMWSKFKYNEDPDVFTLEIYEEDVQWVAT